MTHPPPPRASLGSIVRAVQRSIFTALVLVAFLGTLCAPAAPAAAGSGAGDEVARSALTRTDWRWPTDPPRRIAAPFVAPPSPYAAGHRGIDIEVSSGAAVYAMAPGAVSFAGVVVDRPLVSIDHGGGLVSSIEPVEPVVAEGAPVTAGQLIGRVSSGGHCVGCIHVGVRLYGAYVNPLGLLGEIQRAVLLPLPDG